MTANDLAARIAAKLTLPQFDRCPHGEIGIGNKVGSKECLALHDCKLCWGRAIVSVVESCQTQTPDFKEG